MNVSSAFELMITLYERDAVITFGLCFVLKQTELMS